MGTCQGQLKAATITDLNVLSTDRIFICRNALGIRDFEMVQDLGWNHPTLEMLMIRDTEH